MESTRPSSIFRIVSVLLAIALALVASASLCVGEAHAVTVGKPAVASVKSGAVGKLTVKVKAVKGAKGYQYVASTSKRFDKGATYYLESSTVAKTSATFADLKEGKTYYVRARAYAKKGKYGKWSAVKPVKVKASTALADAKAEAASYKSKYEAAAAEAAQYKKERDAAKSEAASYKAKYEAAQSEASKYKVEADAAKAEAGDYKSRYESAAAEAAQYKSELESADPDAAGYKERYEAAQADLDAANAEIARLRLQIDASAPATITYDADGGKLPDGTKTELYAEDGDYTLPTPTRAGYDFSGWFDGDGDLVTTVNRSGGNVSVKARWAEIERAYVYVDAGRRSAKTTAWDDEAQSYPGIKLYELYIMDGSDAPEVGSRYEDGTVVSVAGKADGEAYPAGSINLLVEAEYSSLALPSFKECVSIDLSKADTSGVTRMSGMFGSCSELAYLDVSGWDTSNVTRMSQMFYYCGSLKDLKGVEGWDTSSVTDMSQMFYYCGSLKDLKGVEGWDTSSVATAGAMFLGCSSLESLDLSRWDAAGFVDLTADGSMFEGCRSLKSLSISGWDLSSEATSDHHLNGLALFSGCTSLESIDVTGLNPPKSCRGFFTGCSALKELKGIGTWNVVKVTDMSRMFANCSSLESLDLSRWDVRNVTDVDRMFDGCSSLASLDVSDWNTSSVTGMYFMFYGCSSLASLDVSDWNTSSVTGMYFMFYGCSSLASLDLSGWDTSGVTSMHGMFQNCSSLASLDLSGWDTSAATEMGGMFASCSNLSFLKTGPSWTTSAVTSTSLMPVFQREMQDESGVEYAYGEVVPDGAHTYTIGNPQQAAGLQAASSPDPA